MHSNVSEIYFQRRNTTLFYKDYVYLKAKSILFFPKTKMGYFLIPEFIWLHYTYKGYLSRNNILQNIEE